MACHIYAAAAGPAARRRNPQLSFDELRSIENGIWMCYTHGKIIDTDECTYTPQMLKHWRSIAEKKAHIRQKTGAEVDLAKTQNPDVFLLDLNRELAATANLNKDISEVYFATCICDIWGVDLGNLIREFTIELARNAFVHGKASTFVVSVESNKITLRDNGAAFSLSNLLLHSEKRGGAAAAKQLTEYFSNELICSYLRQGDENVTILARIHEPGEICALTPCSLELTFDSHDREYNAAITFCEAHQECGVVYLIPKDGISHSDVVTIANRFAGRPDIVQKIVLVCSDVSRPLEDFVRQIAPNISLMQLPHG
jgi:hypothetical protein